MSTENRLLTLSFLAGADLSALQYTAVKPSTAAALTVLGATTNTDIVLGILQNKPTSGQPAEIAFGGQSKAIAGGTITQGDLLTVTTGGALITATGDALVCAIALESGLVGETRSVLLLPGIGALASASKMLLSTSGGKRLVGGQATTVTASDTIVTGLTTVIAAGASLDSAPVVTCTFASASIGDQAGTPAAGSILLQTWMPTNSSTTTPIAATTFSKKANWWAFGT